jgi:hypothetical protein
MCKPKEIGFNLKLKPIQSTQVGKNAPEKKHGQVFALGGFEGPDVDTYINSLNTNELSDSIMDQNIYILLKNYGYKHVLEFAELFNLVDNNPITIWAEMKKNMGCNTIQDFHILSLIISKAITSDIVNKNEYIVKGWNLLKCYSNK